MAHEYRSPMDMATSSDSWISIKTRRFTIWLPSSTARLGMSLMTFTRRWAGNCLAVIFPARRPLPLKACRRLKVRPWTFLSKSLQKILSLKPPSCSHGKRDLSNLILGWTNFHG